MKIDEITKELIKLSSEVANLSSGKGDAKAVSDGLAALLKEVQSSNQQQMLASEIASAIEAKIKDGELLTKEAAEARVAEVIKSKEAEIAEANRIAGIRSARIEKLKAAGVELDIAFSDNIKDEKGNPLTILEFINSISCDAEGDRAFEIQFSMLSSIVKHDKEETTTKTGEAKTEQVASAASKRRVLTAGAGNATGTHMPTGTVTTKPSPDRTLAGKGVFGRR